MSARPIFLPAVALVTLAGASAAQTPPGPAPHPVAPQVAARTFPTGADVLSVDGERLGVLAQVELRPGGERLLHIRGADGSIATAPASVASRGERAVVLEWTRAQFESAANKPPKADAPGASPPAT